MKIYFSLLDQEGVASDVRYTGAMIQPYEEKANHNYMGLCIFSIQPTLQLLELDLLMKLDSYLESVNRTRKDCNIIRNYTLRDS